MGYSPEGSLDMLVKLTLIYLILSVSTGCSFFSSQYALLDSRKVCHANTSHEVIHGDKTGYLSSAATADTRIASPTGIYTLFGNRLSSNKNDAGCVFLLNNSTGQVNLVFDEYARDIGIIWSPDGERFVINDYYGSGQSTSRVYHVKVPSQPIVDIEELLLKEEENNPGSFSFMKNDKTYIQTLGWHSNDRIKVTVHGWGDNNTNGYRIYMDYVLGKGMENIHIFKRK